MQFNFTEVNKSNLVCSIIVQKKIKRARVKLVF